MAIEIPGIKTHIIINLLTFILVFYAIFHLTSKECVQHTDCGPYAYCGVDDKCHEFTIEIKEGPTIETSKNEFILLSIVIAILLIIGSIFYVKNEN